MPDSISNGMPDGVRYLDVGQVADALRVKRETVTRWLRTGRLEGLRLGGPRLGWRVSEPSLKQFVEAAIKEQRRAKR